MKVKTNKSYTKGSRKKTKNQTTIMKVEKTTHYFEILEGHVKINV
jgi:hypothetical protein